jgi:hypothetical protein
MERLEEGGGGKSKARRKVKDGKTGGVRHREKGREKSKR